MSARITKAQAKALGIKVPRKHKYNARRVTVDGRTFDSAKEAKRYGELKLLQQAGEITGLQCQVKMPLDCFSQVANQPSQRNVANYVVDFVYTEKGEVVWEDCKGVRTPMYRLKKKWMLLQHGIEIRET